MPINKKIAVVLLCLLAIFSVLLFNHNQTYAVTGQLTFSITGVANIQCTYPTHWDMGSYTTIPSSFVASGSSTGVFLCTDTQGLSSWSMTLQAISPVTDGTTIIPATGVSMQATVNQVTNGDCTTGTNTSTMTSIGSTPGTIMAKASALNQICTITTTSVILNVAVPGYASVGTYTGSLTLIVPR